MSLPGGLRKALEEAGFTVLDTGSVDIASVSATTIAVILLIEEVIDEDPEGAERVLRSHWLDVADQLKGKSHCRPQSFLLLNEYFCHGADWKRMRECIAKHSGVTPEILDPLIAARLKQVRCEYAQDARQRKERHS